MQEKDTRKKTKRDVPAYDESVPRFFMNPADWVLS